MFTSNLVPSFTDGYSHEDQPFHDSVIGNSQQLTECESGKSIGKNDPINKSKTWRVLIAEDDLICARLLKILLTKEGHNVLSAKNGMEAVEICRNNPNIDLVLMDILMPVMNGFDAMRIIRQINREIVIIAQTVLHTANDRKMAIKSGCNNFITKPIRLSYLIEMIKKEMQPKISK